MIARYLNSYKNTLSKSVRDFCETITVTQESPVDISNLTNDEKTKLKQSILNISIPKTSFNPRFSAKTKEIEYLSKISTSLYDWQRKQNRDKIFRVLDSPIPIDSELHIGHFLNRTLKDIINRYKLLNGFEVEYAIGFQCYGLNILNEALAEKIMVDDDEKEQIYFSSKSYKNKFDDDELRLIVKDFQVRKIKQYLMSQHRWGLLTDYRTVYTTMSSDYIDSMLEVFQILVRMGYLRRSHMPNFQAPKTMKFISSGEVDYNSDHKKHYFIKYKVVDYGDDDIMKDQYPDLSFIAYASELWALQGMEALAVHPKILYCIVMIGEEFYIIGKERMHMYYKELKKQKKGGLKVIKTLQGENLSHLKVKNFMNDEVKSIIPDMVIRNTYGSSINIVCPSIYVDDFKLAQVNDLKKDPIITMSGEQISENEQINMQKVPESVDQVMKLWQTKNNLVFNFTEEREFFYMIDKISNQRVFLYNSEVWALKNDQEDIQDMIEELVKTKRIGNGSSPNFPDIEDYLSSRESEWCISTRSEIGVPVPVFKYKDDKKNAETSSQKFLIKDQLINYVRKQIFENGIEIWYKWDIESLLPPEFKHQAPELEKDDHVFDFWFESSVCWHAVLERKIHQKKGLALKESDDKDFIETEVYEKYNDEFYSPNYDSGTMRSEFNSEASYPCDLQVEGLDSGDGSLQSQILSQAMIKGYPGFNAQKIHPIFIDVDGKKISKSNNIIKMDDQINGTLKANDNRQHGLGVDVLRLLCASIDIPEETKGELSIESLEMNVKQSEVNQIRKLFWGVFRLVESSFEFDLDKEQPNPEPKTEQESIDFQIKNFFGGNQESLVEQAEETENYIDKLFLNNHQLFLTGIQKSYEEYNISQAYRIYMDYMKHYVMDYYLTSYQKLFIDESNNNISLQRNRKKFVVRFLKRVIYDLIVTLAPILPFNTENIFQEYTKQRLISVFQMSYPNISQNDRIMNNISSQHFFEISGYKSQANKINELLTKHMNRIGEKDRSYFDVVFMNEHLGDSGDNQARFKTLALEAQQFLRKIGEEGLADFMNVNEVKILNEGDRLANYYKYQELCTFKINIHLQNRTDTKDVIYLQGLIFHNRNKKRCIRCRKRIVTEIGGICPKCNHYVNKKLFEKYKMTPLFMYE